MGSPEEYTKYIIIEKSLNELRMRAFDKPLNKNNIQIISYLPDLKCIEISDTDVFPGSFSNIDMPKSVSTLELSFSRGFNDDDYHSLSSMVNLSSLDLRKCNPSEIGFDFFKNKLNYLKELHLDANENLTQKHLKLYLHLKT